MKPLQFCLTAVTAVLFATSAMASDAWQTDYEAALSKAEKENKKVLLNFTGSDWCGWCIRLDKETFTQNEFKEFAGKNLVLVKLDFPNEVPQSDEVKKQNQKLQQQYGIQGYPTLVLLDAKGKELARQNYIAGGPAGFEKWVNSVK